MILLHLILTCIIFDVHFFHNVFILASGKDVGLTPTKLKSSDTLPNWSNLTNMTQEYWKNAFQQENPTFDLMFIQALWNSASFYDFLTLFGTANVKSTILVI